MPKMEFVPGRQHLDVAGPPNQSSRINVHRRVVASQPRRRIASCNVPSTTPPSHALPVVPSKRQREPRRNEAHAAAQTGNACVEHIGGSLSCRKWQPRSTQVIPLSCQQRRTHMERTCPATCLVVGRLRSSCAHETLALRASFVESRGREASQCTMKGQRLTCRKTGRFPASPEHPQGSGACEELSNVQ